MDEPALPVAAVARRLGVAPATLRTWDRRYGLGPSEHVPGVHRRYTSQDLLRLEAMRRFIMQGVAPADAARAALEADLQSESDDVPSVPAEPVVPRGTGGAVLPMPGGSAEARGLARAATALDSRAMTAQIEASLSERGVIATWDELVAPALIGVGDRYESTGRGVEIEHALSEAALSALRPFPRRTNESRNARPVLLAAADEEQHTLPLYATAAALAERNVQARVLGARVPTEALSAAITRIGPGAILVWSQADQTGDPSQLERIPAQRPSAPVMAGGPGWPDRLPAGIARPANLTQAVALLAAAVAPA
jgi:MerR family transcriptional regulator, light-induced transcriptional regulator